jgi:hypothetical protein
MTEEEVIAKAREAFERRDSAARQLHEVDTEIKCLVHEYSLAMRLWGFTPDMLRQAVRARLGEAA